MIDISIPVEMVMIEDCQPSAPCKATSQIYINSNMQWDLNAKDSGIGGGHMMRGSSTAENALIISASPSTPPHAPITLTGEDQALAQGNIGDSSVNTLTITYSQIFISNDIPGSYSITIAYTVMPTI